MIGLYIFLALIILVILVSYYFCTRIIYPKVFPVQEVYRMELEAGKINEAEWDSWQKQEVHVQSPYGYDLFGVYLPIDGSRKTAVISHGITVNLYTSIKYVNLFRHRGFNVLLYDLRNHGHNRRKNTTFGLYEKYDLKAVVDWAFQQVGKQGIVGTMGESLGAATTLQHAAIDPRIAFAIDDCGYSDLKQQLAYRLKVEYHLFPFPLLDLANLACRWITGMAFEMVSPIRDMRSISTPILFIHGQNDDYISPAMCQAMYEAKINGEKMLYLAPNAGHAEAYWNNREEYDRKVGKFLGKVDIGS